MLLELLDQLAEAVVNALYLVDNVAAHVGFVAGQLLDSASGIVAGFQPANRPIHATAQGGNSRPQWPSGF
jgi:hypothetical protein